MPKWGDIVIWVGLSGIAVLHAWQFRFVSIDDAYITYRYAENIANGLGFVFNPGERVEGTSTFLFTLLLALAGLLRSNIELTARCLGTISFVALICLAHNHVRRSIPGLWGNVLALGVGLAVASSTPLAFHAAIGMELLLYTALLTAGVLGYIQHAQKPAQGRNWMLWLALAGATRSEGLSVAIGLLGITAVQTFARRKNGNMAHRVSQQELIRDIALLAAVIVPLLTFRTLYFGTWVPNSVTAKSGFFQSLLALPPADIVTRVSQEQGVKMLQQFGAEFLGNLWVLLPIGLLSRRFRLQTSIFLMVGLLLVAVVIWNNGDWMPHSRLLAPMIPFFWVGVASNLSLIQSLGRWRKTLSTLQLLAASVTFSYGVKCAFYERTFATGPNPAATYMIDLGKALLGASDSSETLATDMAGRVPYFSRLRTVDMFGLCDKYIAHHGTPAMHMGKMDHPYVYRKQPSYYFYNYAFTAHAMLRSKEFRPYVNDYWVVFTPFNASHRRSQGKVLLARKDLPRLADLVTSLHATLIAPKEL